MGLSTKYPATQYEKIETFTEEVIRHKKHYTQYNDASVPFEVGTLGLHTVLPASSTVQNTLQNSLLESPSVALLYFPESH